MTPPTDKAPKQRSALGRGLSALIPSAPSSASQRTPTVAPAPAPEDDPSREAILTLSVSQIECDPNQPRKVFDPVALEELAASIKVHGIIQPLIVRKMGAKYRIIAGERRWRASQIAGLTELPAIVRNLEEKEAFEQALIENLQRSDLNPIEEAEGYQRLVEEFDLTQELIAQRVGKERSTVANALRLLNLPDEIKASISSGDLSMGHAKVILGLQGPDQMRQAATQVIVGKLSVRATEQLVKKLKEKLDAPESPPTEPSRTGADVQIRARAEELQRAIGTRVRIHDKEGKGKLELEYASHADLDRILDRLIPGRPS